MADSMEPRRDLVIDGVELTVLGTAHVSRASADQVRKLIQSGDYDSVAVELCRSRFNALMDPRTLAQMDLFSVIRQNRVYMVVANLVLAAYQQRLADQFGIEPGAEQRTALRLAKDQGLNLLLVDREIGITLKRISANLGWWKRYGLFAGLLAAMVSSDEVTEEEVERLKEGDVLETAFAEFAAERRDLYVPLIEERDRYMAARLRRELARVGARRALVVIGAGHLKGVTEALETDRTDPAEVLGDLERVPPPSRWPAVFGWTLLILILAGFGYGFAVSPELGLDLLIGWALITGGLSALGTLLAAGHPLTILSAFLAAPLTTLNPAIGAGMITGAVELYLRKPSVGEFSRLRSDVATWTGWWRNRVSRVLVVFVLSSLGAGIGTYVAGLHIAERLIRAGG
ncbi:TraB/GumN family protein [Allochromatium vinosum]|uniref:TraB family protein n=1 Tax=Allochromatium vinosum (strain ATCC 17899 / DSM 180 / NBRC 103801 / NCIMB 10441 / D) TaxID=572477 RepID=D3RUZ8_ALLVD|nr:TraB/GumN family protein [Allochromatium vinosum]ADC61047.1 TraB family protein [Allochromatium vinosum DSM 180]MBK1655106.1 TraB family protein [Allochromatium vinosum]